MKHILILLFILSSTQLIQSQEFEAKDIKVFSGDFNSHEQFHIDQQGNHFIAGKGTGAIDFDFGPDTNALPETSLYDLYIAKYNSDKNISWLLSFDGNDISNRINTLITDAEGNLYIGGEFSGSLQLTNDGLNEITAESTTNMFVAKFDSNGDLMWKFMIGEKNFTQSPIEMYISDEKLIILFEFDGDFDVDPGPGTTMIGGDSNGILVCDLNGTFIDAYSYRGDIEVHASLMDEGGNLYLSGSFSGLVSFDFKTNASVISTGPFDAFVAKYDNEFNLMWIKKVGKSSSVNKFYHLALDTNDDLIMAGKLASEITIGVDTTANDANYIIKMTKDGAYTSLTEILPKSFFIFNFETNSKDQLIIFSTLPGTVDIDPTENTYELSPLTGYNFFLVVYESDFSLFGSDQGYADGIISNTIYLDDSENIHILTDFMGQGKCVLGSPEILISAGEESFVYYTLDIDGCAVTEESILVESCDEIIINSETYSTSGDYQQILTNAEGCDSVLSIVVNIYPSTVTDTSILSCGYFNYNGEIIGVSGTYSFSLTSVNGCDSAIMIALDIVELNTGITVNGNELSADESEGFAYQWYDCDTDLMIEGANARTFSPETDGSYRVQVFKEVCSFFTDCIPFTLVNIVELDIEVNISPNPTDGLIYLSGDIDFSSYHIKLFDLTGKEVNISSRINTDVLLDISHVSPGVYLIKLENNQKALVKKIIKF